MIQPQPLGTPSAARMALRKAGGQDLFLRSLPASLPSSLALPSNSSTWEGTPSHASGSWPPLRSLTRDSSTLSSASDFILALPELHQAPPTPTHNLIEIIVGEVLGGSEGPTAREGGIASSGAQIGCRAWGEFCLCLLYLETLPFID